jgi:hypothetical protein
MTMLYEVLAHGGTGGWIVDGSITAGVVAVAITIWLRTRNLIEEDEQELQRKIDGWRDDDR